MSDLEDVEERLTELEFHVDALSKKLETAEEQNEWLESELKKRDQRIDELEHEIEQIQSRTDLLDRVEQASALKPEQRAAVLIQTLYNEAINTDNERASIDAKGAVKALGGGVDRTLMYGETGAFQKAVDLVGDESVLKLIKENRSSSKNTRLELDLGKGKVPEQVAGVKIAGGASD